MRYVLRVCLPDRPGALGELATALGRAGIDIAAFSVIDREDGVAIDDVTVDAEVGADRLRVLCEAVAGVVVEALDPVDDAPQRYSATALAAHISERPSDALPTLVEGLPRTLGASWALALNEGPDGMTVIARSPTSPDVPAALRLPYLPLETAQRLPQAAWMPDAWLSPRRVEIAAARLDVPFATVLLARDGGPRFRGSELRRLESLARVAVATSKHADLAPVGGVR